jgi:glycosyltransferase involved in cell wall biosynthesis
MTSILAFESFDGGSHRQFRETLTRHSSHDWTWLTRPPRGWKWRMTISALEIVNEMNNQNISKPECLFATSLLDTATLRAALPRGWRDIPLVLYMHENQIAYPSNDRRDASFAFTNLRSVLTSDLTIFNSKWNMDSFIAGILKLLKYSPDCSLGNVEQRIRERSTVAWVPVALPKEDTRVLHNRNMEGPKKSTTVVWPHRWEHDKDPERLLELAREHTQALDLRWIILGEQFTQIPDALKQFSDEFEEQIDHIGYVESKAEYWKWLHKADWVLSTAKHEFFGIAVVEALFAGCLPWVPEKLSYPELLPACARGLTPMLTLERTSITAEIQKHLFMAQAIPGTNRIDSLISSVI